MADLRNEIKIARITEAGDVECPRCHCNVITPVGYSVVPGIGECPLCHQKFRITEAEAFTANTIDIRFPKGK